MKQADEYAYDNNGNLTKDLNKGITGIQYNCLNLPSKVIFSDGSTVTYVYAADGMKRRTVHTIGSATTTTDYCSNVVYENNTAKLLLTEEGYVSLNGNKYHYYLKDHLGNNRVVVDQNGNVEETNHYYPFGGIFASTGNIQPYKYNGKELDIKKGLNWYDYGARMYDAVLGRWHVVDPMAEKYHAISPHVYCMNNPMSFIDPTGKEVVALDEESRRNISNTLTKKEAKYVRFEKNGTLNVSRLNRSKSKSENMLALKRLANSETTYNFSVTDKDVEGEAFSQTYKGLTAIPGEENKPSPDGNVWIQTSSFLDEKGQAQNVAHEAYGHAYFYDLNKTDKSYDYHHRYQNVAGEAEWDADFNIYIIPNVRTETNLRLKKQIEIVTKQARKNYDDRKK